MKSEYLKDFEVNIKLKLAFLWVAVMFCYVYGDYFELYVPEKVSGLLSGNNLLNSPMKLFLASILMTIPALMTYLSLTLKPKVSKLLNIIFGTFFTVVMVFIAGISISLWRTFYIYLSVVEIILTIIIVWSALRWPKLSIKNEI